ncbi:GntR family transcriptional regulator [Alkalilacustris brevis]|uniref:GntR family transcriptional regulator n=1 Tax=Alkalilacustris brevis TaxID=2026338 RepID=UPI0013903D9F|nr:GntR family transcriptional regulator [Alkalilacustris brevis]
MSRAHEIYEALITDLRKGKYRYGDRLRAEVLASEFGVSRTPVREALSRLQERGLLEMTPAGLAVTRLTRQHVLELYAAREVLEGSAARYAAQHASPSDIATMRDIARAFAESAGDSARTNHLNRMLHNAIYEAAHNRYLMTMLDGMNDTLMLLPTDTFDVPNRINATMREHEAILAAIEARDPDAAEAAARAHIREALQVRLSLMFNY